MSLADTRHVATSVPNDLESLWLPFTANRAFKKAPRLIARARNMHYFTTDGRAVLDGAAGLWCCNAGHNRDPIVEAIRRQAAELDYAPASSSAIPGRSNSPIASPRRRRATSTTCSSAIPARRPSTAR